MRTAFNFAQEIDSIGGKQLKIGEVSKRSGIGIEALRFYEKSGLLDRPSRTYSGYRLYDESVLDRLAFVKRLRYSGSLSTRSGNLSITNGKVRVPAKRCER